MKGAELGSSPQLASSDLHSNEAPSRQARIAALGGGHSRSVLVPDFCPQILHPIKYCSLNIFRVPSFLQLLLCCRHDVVALCTQFPFARISGERSKHSPRRRALTPKAVFERIEISHQAKAYAQKRPWLISLVVEEPTSDFSGEPETIPECPVLAGSAHSPIMAVEFCLFKR